MQKVSFNNHLIRQINNIPNISRQNYTSLGISNGNDNDTISFRSRMKFLSFNDFITNTVGTLNLESANEIKRITTNFLKSNPSNDIIANKAKQNTEDILLLFKKLRLETKRDKSGLKIAYDEKILTESNREKIKKSYIKSLIGRKYLAVLDEIEPLGNTQAINDWFKNVPYESKLPNNYHSTCVHPITKAKSLISNFTLQEKDIICQKSKKIKKSNLTPIALENKKIQILNNIRSILNSDNLQIKGLLSATELKKLRSYVAKYDTYDKAFDNNIFSKESETIRLNPIQELSKAKIGDFIENLGLVVQKTEVYDKDKKQNIPCLILFNKEKVGNGFQLRKIDEDFENRTKCFINKFNKIKILINSNKNAEKESLDLNNEALEIINAEQKLNISKVVFNLVSVNHLRIFLKDIKQSSKVEDLINELSKKSKKVVLIDDFINSDSKKYYEGGRKVVLPLIHLSQKHKCNTVVQALAIGENKKSPVRLYLRAGFKPLSHTEEDIQKIYSEQGFWDPKVPVYLYLPDNSMVNNIATEQKPLQEIFNLKI